MRIITPEEQQAVDRIWQEKTGLPLLLLMEAAAAAVVRQCREYAAERNIPRLPVLVLAGKGQNGGDAFACARMLLAGGWPVVCRELYPDAALPAEAAANRQALIGLGCCLGPATETDFALDPNGLILDGLFGSGYQGGRKLPEEFVRLSSLIADARRRGVRVIAIDVPSGLDAGKGTADPSCLQADCTVTFVRPKIGLCTTPGRFLAGRLIVDPIGIGDDLLAQALAGCGQPPAYLLCPDEIRTWCPKRPADSHKGLFGKALVIGGAPGMPGALVLAAEAAARSGVGLLHLAVPLAIAPAVLASRPEALVSLIDPDDETESMTQIHRLSAQVQAVAIGPGINRPAWLESLLADLIETAPQLVIDADALNQMSINPDTACRLLLDRGRIRHLPPAVLTPHPGEFHRLAPDLDLQDRRRAACELAVRSGSIVVLKGAATIVAEPSGRCWINPTGQDGLARGGSGDVLCGLIAGLLAQGLPPHEAAAAGVYLHGLAADLAAARLGRRAMLPRDVITELGRAYSQTGWEVENLS
ncbi:MAG: NAD(P)H-hydrate dehydratase [Clostridiaceae bacterium]|nr:NAD(P)H-hydrate dehydratase [Clostridiaceae bacterium]